jgi:lysophospholipase L1-like esterase
MRSLHLLIAIVFFIMGVVCYFILQNSQTQATSMYLKQYSSQDNIRFIPIGDSYTIGLGVDAHDRWPNMVVKKLQESGTKIEIDRNPSVSGYTVDDAIRYELPVVQKEKPDFVTVFIGANDSFRLGKVETFKRDYQQLLDGIERELKNQNAIVLITLPDYTVSPAGKDFREAERLQVGKLIEVYNEVIKAEATRRGLTVADIYPVSKEMTTPDFYINDGLHPSAKGYQRWNEVIFPVIQNHLSK